MIMPPKLSGINNESKSLRTEIEEKIQDFEKKLFYKNLKIK